MNIEDLISQYLDGSLASEAEADLHHRLAVSPEARQLFRAHIMLRGIARDQRVLHVPTSETRTRLFDRLVKEEGMQLPPMASVPASAAPHAIIPEPPPRPAPIPSAAARRTGSSERRKRRVLPWLIPSLVASMMFLVVLNTSWMDNLSDTTGPEIASTDPGTSKKTVPGQSAPDANVPSASAPGRSAPTAKAPAANAPGANASTASASTTSAPSLSAEAAPRNQKATDGGEKSTPTANAVEQRKSSYSHPIPSDHSASTKMSVPDASALQSPVESSRDEDIGASISRSTAARQRLLNSNIVQSANGRASGLSPAANSSGGALNDASIASYADDQAKRDGSNMGEQAMAMNTQVRSDGLDNAIANLIDSSLTNEPDYDALSASDLKLPRHMVPHDNVLDYRSNREQVESEVQLSNSVSGPEQRLFAFGEMNASAPPPAAATAEGGAGNGAMESASYSSIHLGAVDTVAVQSPSGQFRGSQHMASPVLKVDGVLEKKITSLDSSSVAAEQSRHPMLMELAIEPAHAPLTAVVGLQQNSLASLERSTTQMQVLIRAGIEFGEGDHLIFGVVSGAHYRETTSDKLVEVMYDGQLFPSEAVATTGESSKTVISESEQNEVWGGGGYRFSREIAKGWRVGIGVWTGAGNRYIRVASEVPVTYQPVQWIRIEFLPMVQYTAAHGETTHTTLTSFNPTMRYSEKVERTSVLEFDKELNLGIGIGASVLW